MSFFIKITLALGLIASIVYAADSTEVKQKASETVDAATEYTKAQKEEIQKGMEKNLNAMADEIKELKKQAKKATGSAKDEMNTQITGMETKQGELKADLARLKKSSGKAWSELKSGMSAAMDKLSESYSKAKKEFKDSKSE
jgi:hypothetical protein